ncbi:MAG: adenosylcobinamide-GDP ribazoletransferase, partial [Planctomycetales bacterium]|nr:adenosylcobinamide-GDP ribazoletransferase [Planctomycetales bacterium]
MRPFLVALSFLTRLPVPLGDVPADELPRSVPFFPVVGLLLGIALAAAAWAMRGVGLSPTVIPVLAVGLLALLTGGLHLDGLADSFDALGGGRRDRGRMLEIMKDPHVGAHGAAAVVLVLLAKVAGVAAADPRTLLAFPVVARWAVIAPVALFPAARPEGLAASFRGAIGPLDLALATALAVAVPG